MTCDQGYNQDHQTLMDIIIQVDKNLCSSISYLSWFKNIGSKQLLVWNFFQQFISAYEVQNFVTSDAF